MGKRHPNLLLSVAVLVVLFLAGCSGKNSPAAADPGAPKAVADDSTGAVTGLVMDDAALPLAGATVGIVEHKLETRTDENGQFALSGIPPGKARLAAHKLGFEDSIRTIDITPGQVLTFNVQLKAIPLPGVARSELKVLEGRIVCGHGQPYLTQAVCGAAIDEAGQAIDFQYVIDKNATGQLWEQAWRPTQVLSRDLVFSVEKDGCGVQCASGETFSRRQGCCLIRSAVNDTKMDIDSVKAGSQGATIQSRTFPAFGTTAQPLTVFLDQKFTIYWEQFWGDLPEDFYSTRTNVPE